MPSAQALEVLKKLS